MSTMYDLIIVGAGPAGTAGGVYAARKRLKTMLITESFGGQSVVSLDIQNWIGTPHISGPDLAASFEQHLKAYAGDVLTITKGRAVRIEKHDESFSVSLASGDVFHAATVLITTGADRRTLDVPGAAEYEHKGIVYCASCDGPLFSGMDTVVIGGGNAGFETAAQLLSYAKSVTLLQRSGEFRADPITVESVLAHPHMKALTNAKITRVLGDAMVTGVEYKDTTTGACHIIPTSGVFVEIGLLPNTALAEHLLDIDSIKRIKVNPKNQRTSVEGIWAAGDCTDELYHQNNIAAGDGVKALEDIYFFLKAKRAKNS